MLQGISSPPCSRSAEYLQGPVTLHETVDPARPRNTQQAANIALGIWATIMSDLHTATAKRSWILFLSSLHASSSPRWLSQISLYTWFPRIIESTANKTDIDEGNGRRNMWHTCMK